MSGDPSAAMPTPVDRVRLEALRYAVTEESVTYIAIMRTFAGSMAGLLSDQSVAEVAAKLDGLGIALDADTVDDRLRYLVEHGNLALSPRETEARTIRDYLSTRARYQLTQRGELAHRQVEELLGSTEVAREVSSEMLAAVLDGIRALASYDEARLSATPPDRVVRELTTVLAQFERLVESTRGFYTYLGDVLNRYDLERGEFQLFKDMLIDYLQRFVDEVQRHEPLVVEAVRDLFAGSLDAALRRAAEGARLVSVDGSAAQRDPGLVRADWESLRTWFAGDGVRPSDASQVRALATRAISSLLVNLRRIAGPSGAERSRYSDVVRLAGWFDAADDETAHALWAAAFGLYGARHLGFLAAGEEGTPVPATTSWWVAPSADVPVALRDTGSRAARGRPAQRLDFADAKRRRLREREQAEAQRQGALDELARLQGESGTLRLSDRARDALLDLYGRAITGSGSAQEADIEVVVRRVAGAGTVLVSPSGRLELVDLSVAVRTVRDVDRERSA